MDERPHQMTQGRNGQVPEDIDRLEKEIDECQNDLIASTGELKRRLSDSMSVSAKGTWKIVIIAAGVALAAIYVALLFRRKK